MKQSAGRILLRYLSTVALLLSLMSLSLFTTIRRSRVRSRAYGTCVTTTVVIASSVTKLAILLSNPAINEASNNLGNLP